MGIAAGKDFVATVFNVQGAVWVGYGVLITIIPLIVVGVIARWKYKINYFYICGMMSGGYTDPPARLPTATRSPTTTPRPWHTPTVYPLTMFMRVVAAQMIVLFFL